MRGSFFGKREASRRRRVVVQSCCAGTESPPHPPLRGTFSPSKDGEKGKWDRT